MLSTIEIKSAFKKQLSKKARNSDFIIGPYHVRGGRKLLISSLTIIHIGGKISDLSSEIERYPPLKAIQSKKAGIEVNALSDFFDKEWPKAFDRNGIFILEREKDLDLGDTKLSLADRKKVMNSYDLLCRASPNFHNSLRQTRKTFLKKYRKYLLGNSVGDGGLDDSISRALQFSAEFFRANTSANAIMCFHYLPKDPQCKWRQITHNEDMNSKINITDLDLSEEEFRKGNASKVSTKNRNFYYIPFTSNTIDNIPRSGLLFDYKRKIKYKEIVRDIEFIELCIGHYFSIMLPLSRVRFIKRLDNMIDKESQIDFKANITRKIDIRSNLSEFLEKTLPTVVKLCSSDSATFRKFYYSTKSLELLGEFNDKEFTKRTAPIRDYNAIRITDSTSINARVFRNQVPIRTNSKEVLKYRNTLDNLCIPVFFGSTCIGTFNCESTHPNAFNCNTEELPKIVSTNYFLEGDLRNSDVIFLGWFALKLQGYINAIYSTNDLYFLTKRAYEESNSHELINTIENLKIPEKEKEKLKIAIFTGFKPLHTSKSPSTADISILVNAVINRAIPEIIGMTHETELARDAERKKIVVNNSLSKPIKGYEISYSRYELIASVICNLIRNMMKHSKNDLDKLIIDHCVIKDKNIIKVVMTTVTDEDIDLQYVGMAPLAKGTEKRKRRGLMVCGVIARRIGGFMNSNIVEENGVRYLKIYINLPLD